MSYRTRLCIGAIGVLGALACQRLTTARSDGSESDASSGTGGSSTGAPGDGGIAGASASSRGGEGGTGGEGGEPSVPSLSGAGGEPSVPSLGGAGGTRDCRDFGLELCMKLTWPNAVVPYVIEPAWGQLITANVRRAIDVWDGQLVGRSQLILEERTSSSDPKLVFTLEPGCGPIGLSEAEVTVAIGSCRAVRDIAIAIGVVLGVPPMHRRADRDRYLIVGDESSVDCAERRFLDKCPDRAGVPAQLGPFEFASTMFARAATDAETCSADHSAMPYLARGAPESACGWVTGKVSSGTGSGGEVAELYAMREGWLPYVPIGKDLGPDAPLVLEPGPGLPLLGAALLATDEGGLAAFALAGFPPKRSLHVIENPTGSAWGSFRELAGSLPGPDHVQGPEVARRASTSSKFDIAFNSNEAVFVATTDVSTAETTSWTTFGTPGSASWILSMAATASARGGLSVYVYAPAAAAEPELAGIFRRELDWGDWQEVPLPASDVVALDAVTAPDGTEHLAVATTSSILYGARAGAGSWSAWTELNAIPPPASDGLGAIALLLGESEPLGVLWQSTDRLWHSSCYAAPCSDATSWTRANAIAAPGGGLSAVATAQYVDVVTRFVEVRPPDEVADSFFPGLWHKRRRLPP
jgi:hypothetical protein